MLELTVNDKNNYSITQEDGKMILNGVPVDWDINWQPNGLVSILYNGKSYTAIVEKTDRKTKEITLRVNGQIYVTSIKEPIDQLLNNLGMGQRAGRKVESVKAPMPGMVLKIMVTVGQHINKGDVLVILEAMKMENILKATASAEVKAIKVEERTAVEKGAVLIELQ